MYDNVCKFLVEHYGQDFAQRLLGEAIALTQLSPSELSLEPIRADSLILLAARSTVLHLEFQTQPDPDIPFRMADYRLRVFRRFPQVQMRQVVIYLKPTRSDLAQQTTFTISGLRHEFDVIRLWEVPTAQLQTSPGLLPLAILGQTDDKPQTLQQIAAQIEQLPDRRERNNVAAATFILSGLVLEKAIVQQILREEIVKESVTYQDILQQGLQQGRQEGRQEESRSLILKQLKRRVGTLPGNLTTQVEGLTVEQLEALGEALLDFTQVTDLTSWLAQNT